MNCCCPNFSYLFLSHENPPSTVDLVTKKTQLLSTQLQEATQKRDSQGLSRYFWLAETMKMDLEPIRDRLQGDDYTFFMHEFEKYLVKEALLQKDQTALFHLSEQLGSRTFDVFTKVVENLPRQDDKSYMSYKLAACKAIVSSPHEQHALTHAEIFQIACFSERLLQEAQKKNFPPFYFRKIEDLLPRALIIDFQASSFYILSKKHGELKAKGTSKKVTNAVKVTFSTNCATNVVEAKASSYVRAVNRRGKIISPEEIALEKRFAGPLLVVSNRGSSGRMKTNILKEDYENNLFVIRRKSAPLNSQLLYTILSKIAQKLNEMHSVDQVHNDIKTSNVQYKVLPDGTVKVKIIDYGLSYNRETLSQLKLHKSYGTPHFTAPEILTKQGRLSDPLEQGKAEDLYAFGCLIYEMVYRMQIPWGQYIRDTRHKMHGHTWDEAIRLQQEGYQKLLQEVQAAPNTEENSLKRLVVQLLDPDPSNRLTASLLLSFLQVIN